MTTKTARLRKALSDHGTLECTGIIVADAARMVRRRFRHLQEWRFDRREGTDTRGLVYGVGNAHSVHYQPVPEKSFSAAMAGIETSGRTFVDLGCGKGKAVYLAQKYRFAGIIGVEIDQNLSAIAQRNVPNAQIACCDAEVYQFPEPPLVVYLYNPFGAVVITEALRRLPAGDVTIVYQAPYQRQAVDAMYSVVREGHGFVVYSGPRIKHPDIVGER